MRAWLLLFVLTAIGVNADPPKRVLILHSFGREFAPFNIISATYRTELAQKSPEPVEFYEASL